MTSDPEEPSYLRLRRQRAEPEPELPADTPRLDPELYEPAYDQSHETYEPPDDQSLLRNPYVLAGLAVAVAIVLAVMVVILFGGGSGKGAPLVDTTNSSDGSVTPASGTATAGGVSAKSLAVATVRESPSSDSDGIGELRNNQDVEVVGRNNDSTWFQIFYPPRTLLRGWVPSSALKISQGVADSLAVVIPTPIPRPTPIPPTLAPEPTGTSAPTPSATPTAQPGLDLALTAANGVCPAVGSPLLITLTNAGRSSISNRRIRITTTSATGVLGVTDTVVSLESGAAVTLPTGHVMQAPRTSVRVDVIDQPGDVNSGNNGIDCTTTTAPILVTPTRVPGLLP